MLDPRLAHRLDAGTLRHLVPALSPTDLHELRTAFARFLSTPTGRKATTWQDAWNTWAQAHPGSGFVEVRIPRCKDCHGRGFDHRRVARNISRTGNPYVCGTCRGTGSGTTLRLRANAAPVPPAIPEPASTEPASTEPASTEPDTRTDPDS